jgi:beta-glucosidase
MHDHKSGLIRPPKELKGFTKIELKPGETRTVSITLDFRAFAYYHPAYKQWITEDGEFDILVGASSEDIRHVRTVTLKSTLKLPSILNRASTPHEWMADPRGQLVFAPFFEQIITQMKTAFGGTDAGEIGMENAMNWLLNIALTDLLYFQGANLPRSPEETVDSLLAQVYSAPE